MASPALNPLENGKAALVLGEAGAARMWNWILARQGLADGHRLESAWHVADAALGLHAARLASPFAIVAARTSNPAIPASLYTAPVRTTLMTVRCMRKTLHILPLHLAAAAHAATLRFRERDARRAVVNSGYANATVERVTGQLTSLLCDGPLPHRVIEERLASSRTHVHLVRLAIKVAWEQGTIAYINAASTWNRQAKSFALTSAAYPSADLSLSREHAIKELITAYFDRYGPATIRDATWWSGLSATDVITALRACGRPLLTVTTPWSVERCLMFADQAAESQDDSGVTTGIQFLAHEDTALKAYFQTRSRYLADVPQPRAFNQIGEALPCVILNGTVAGTWSWNPKTASIAVTLIARKTSPMIRRQVRHCASELTDVLRSAWTSPARPAGPGSSSAIPRGRRGPAASLTTPASPSPAAR